MELETKNPASMLWKLVPALHEKTGQRACVLIDEYDKPLLATLGKPALHDDLKSILKPFFGVLKSVDAHLKFAILTGVTLFRIGVELDPAERNLGRWIIRKDRRNFKCTVEPNLDYTIRIRRRQ